MIDALNDTVMIKPDEAETVTKGGIVLPENRDKDRACTGVVIAVGPGRTEDGKLIPMQTKKGDRVAFHTYPTGLKLEIDRVMYTLLPEKQIMAKLPPKAK